MPVLLLSWHAVWPPRMSVAAAPVAATCSACFQWFPAGAAAPAARKRAGLRCMDFPVHWLAAPPHGLQPDADACDALATVF